MIPCYINGEPYRSVRTANDHEETNFTQYQRHRIRQELKRGNVVLCNGYVISPKTKVVIV